MSWKRHGPHEVKVEVPRGYVNVCITKDNVLIAGSEEENKGVFKFPLPQGSRWEIARRLSSTQFILRGI